MRRRNKIKSPSAVAKAIMGEAPELEPVSLNENDNSNDDDDSDIDKY